MKWQPDRLRVWQEMLMDYLLLHPSASREEMAEAFNVTTQTITNVTTSDLFRYQLDQRRKARAAEVDRSVLARLQDGVAALAGVTVERLTGAAVSGEMDLDGCRETAEMALRAIGYAQTGSTKPQIVQQTVVVVDKELLQNARASMRGTRGSDAGADAQALLPAPSAA